MTQPGPDGQWAQHGGPQQGWPPPQHPGQPSPQHSYPQHPYPQHPYPQSQYPQSQYPGQPDPQQSYPAPGTPAQGHPQAFPQAAWDAHGTPPQEPPRRSRRGLVIGLVVALVVAIGGGATWFALAQRGSAAAGAATPTEAVQNLADSLGTGDVVGLLGTLAPAEAALFTDPLEETTRELKRLRILDESADPTALSGVELKPENLAFDAAQEERVNDHVTITKLTGGTFTVTADLSKVPLADAFLDAMLSRSERRELEQGPQTETVDIAEVVREIGEPIRIATVNVDGAWYPSLLYTIADYALRAQGEAWPRQSIPAGGADSPNEAVRQLVQAALDADVRRVIELLPPDEMGVLHDAGPAILESLGTDLEPSGVDVTRLETQPTQVNGGTRATVTALELTHTARGETMSLVRESDCYRMAMGARTEQLCANELAGIVEEEADSGVPPEARQALRSLGTGLLQQGLGVVTTEVDGKHYVSPFRTFTEVNLTVLRSLRPEDVAALLKIAD
ncbi:hypothetical protein SAMN05421810_109242 [Amycolatopsis arida]|uniref:Flagellar basal body-associated protein FliL n=1 Tax=Amycolatopsis arida TaxID=587909 RepID=A0A1I5ZJ74_9PSEU|nr:flagellar basal body protein FliL [Amycolatopsis arida]TDX89721.1 hypothetical protein CLV69_109242 [Amycolatopsis arida]SFQ56495.1 hypothetical protein SAMN05421810_109242 [Amycolatopsis arida]